MMEPDTELPPLERIIDRRQIDRRNTLIAGLVLAALVFMTVAASVFGLVQVNSSLTDQLDTATEKLDEQSAKLDAQDDRTECVRDLAAAFQDKNADVILELVRYVIGLGNRGDIATLQANLEAAAIKLGGARDAYVAQACPGS